MRRVAACRASSKLILNIAFNLKDIIFYGSNFYRNYSKAPKKILYKEKLAWHLKPT